MIGQVLFQVLDSVLRWKKKFYSYPESFRNYIFIIAKERYFVSINVSCLFYQISEHYSCCWSFRSFFYWKFAIFKQNVWVSFRGNEGEEHRIVSKCISIKETSHSKLIIIYFRLWPCKSSISSIFCFFFIFFIYDLIAKI